MKIENPTPMQWQFSRRAQKLQSSVIREILKVTTMDAASRTLLRVGQKDLRTPDLVESLMGRKPELRYNFIQDNAQFAHDLDI